MIVVKDQHLTKYMATFLRQLQLLVALGVVTTTALAWTLWRNDRMTILNYTNEKSFLVIPSQGATRPTYRMPKLGGSLYV